MPKIYLWWAFTYALCIAKYFQLREKKKNIGFTRMITFNSREARDCLKLHMQPNHSNIEELKNENIKQKKLYILGD